MIVDLALHVLQAVINLVLKVWVLEVLLLEDLMLEVLVSEILLLESLLPEDLGYKDLHFDVLETPLVIDEALEDILTLRVVTFGVVTDVKHDELRRRQQSSCSRTSR